MRKSRWREFFRTKNVFIAGWQPALQSLITWLSTSDWLKSGCKSYFKIMKKIIIAFFATCCFSIIAFAQIPTATLVKIVKAEDERRFDATLENLLKSPAEKIRVRAALAAGRIGDERAVVSLVVLLETDSSVEVRTMAAFALGEIESLQGADAIVKVLADTKADGSVRARSIEAAGKIASANAQDERSKALGEAILDALDYEDKRRSKPNTEAVLSGLTAVLRARPAEGEIVAAKFLTYMNPRIRSDAANTLSRLRAKNANEPLRAMLLSDDDANARANAARALGAAEDAAAFDALLEAALTDQDSRVRVSAIRSLGSLKDKRAAGKLLEHGEMLLADYTKSKLANPLEKSELLEIATTLGRILPSANDEKAIKFLSEFRRFNGLESPEIEIAFARIAPQVYLKKENRLPSDAKVNANQWQFVSSLAQGIGEIANLEASDEVKSIKKEAENLAGNYLTESNVAKSNTYILALPDWLRTYALFKPEDLEQVLREYLKHKDVIVRATAAELLGETKSNEETVEALSRAFEYALQNDTQLNDAQLAILDAFAKIDKDAARGTLLLALHESDYLVRRKAIQLIRANNLANENDVGLLFQTKLAEKERSTVRPFNNFSRSKSGVIFNTNADYIRAVSRKSARAILTTEKGVFTIEFTPEDAPLTVDNFIKLAKSGYFNGLAIHRVVPNFVMQDGDPRGDGNGGPGWQIRCEVNMLSYERGAVGMALSGKDTGGSQWFVTHAPQPHLDGGYTVFGRVSETDMKVVDNLVRGDKIINVKIIEGGSLKSKRQAR